ncbi:hypothetical protein EHQ24_16690 [Leptospira noumeaensis]|uniref:Uncharacterized protein n=1 Tax=Leptospira noumeaensis TaxID=2484964 RepID=A0A4R9I2F0_9LEPT|nr:hypothetical protein [Leptospira noumeaensis]TGK79183.1 hypothetical protein EHQ24_16690 [Leptospira noumeaensis]
MIAFYIAYKEVTNTKRALKLLFKILKQQSADVFLRKSRKFLFSSANILALKSETIRSIVSPKSDSAKQVGRLLTY